MCCKETDAKECRPAHVVQRSHVQAECSIESGRSRGSLERRGIPGSGTRAEGMEDGWAPMILRRVDQARRLDLESEVQSRPPPGRATKRRDLVHRRCRSEKPYPSVHAG